MSAYERDVIVYVVSDSAGDTGDLVVRAAAAQFHPIVPQIRRAPFIADETALAKVVELARGNGAIVLYTLVLPHLREAMVRLADGSGVEAIDLLGPLIHSLERKTGMPSRQEPGLNHVLDEDYFRKVEAVEFAVKYDDARDTTGIKKRTSCLSACRARRRRRCRCISPTRSTRWPTFRSCRS